jgi:hypothetical protein
LVKVALPVLPQALVKPAQAVQALQVGKTPQVGRALRARL